MSEVTDSTGPRILPDGTNLDADVLASHPKERRLQASDSVQDLADLGGYAKGQKNTDGSPI